MTDNSVITVLINQLFIPFEYNINTLIQFPTHINFQLLINLIHLNQSKKHFLIQLIIILNM